MFERKMTPEGAIIYSLQKDIVEKAKQHLKFIDFETPYAGANTRVLPLQPIENGHNYFLTIKFVPKSVSRERISGKILERKEEPKFIIQCSDRFQTERSRNGEYDREIVDTLTIQKGETPKIIQHFYTYSPNLKGEIVPFLQRQIPNVPVIATADQLVSVSKAFERVY